MTWCLLQVKKKKFDNRNQHTNGNNGSFALQMLHNELNQFNGKMGRNKITWMNRSKNNYRSYNNSGNNRYQHNNNGGGYKKNRYINNRRYWSKQR